MPLQACHQLVELVYEHEEGGEELSIRSLLALRPVEEARLLFQGLSEAELDLRIRDLEARSTPLHGLSEGQENVQIRDLEARSMPLHGLSEGKDALPDLREILNRLRALNGLDVAPLFQRYHLRLAELYYRKGRRTEFATLRQSHLENKLLEKRYRALQVQLRAVHASGSNVSVQYRQLQEAKRTWVMCENRLGDMWEPKTKVEAFLESMRLKLLAVLRNPKRYLQNPQRFDKLEKRLLFLNQELERDNDMHRAILHYGQHTATVRRDFHLLLGKSEEELRNRGRLEAAKKDPSAELFASRANAAVLTMLKHYRQLLGEPLIPELAVNADQLLAAPIILLQRKRYASEVIDLYRKRTAAADKHAAQAVAYAKQGYSIDLERVTDPHSLAAVVLHYLSGLSGGLLPHALLLVGDADEPLPARLFSAAQLLKHLPSARLVQIRLLFSHLRHVVKHWKTNHMTAEATAAVFAPVLFSR
jgi:hypothetical protein